MMRGVMRHIQRGPPIPLLPHRYEAVLRGTRKKARSLDCIGRKHAIVGEALPGNRIQSVPH
jgi:hypothetical protein